MASTRIGAGADESAKSLSSLIEYCPLAIVLLDARHRILLVNPAFEKLFLYGASEVLGADIDELIAPEGSENSAEAREITRLVLAGKTFHSTTRRQRKDGTRAEVELYGIPLIDHGRLWGVYALYQDITQRSRAEEAVRRSEEKYREIINFAPLGFFQSTPDRRLIMVNAEFARILGYESPEDVLAHAKPEDFYYDPDERRALIARYDPLGGVSDLEVRFRRKDGSAVWVQIAFHVVRNERGEPQYVEGFVSDISERKRREEALRQSEERFRSIVAGALDAVITINPEGLIETFSPAAEKIFGYRPDEALGLNAGMLVPGIGSELDPDAPAPGAQRRSILGRVTEFEGLRKSGNVFPLEVSLFEISEMDGRRYAAFLRDISERREVEKLKDEFVAMVSHDLKVPLTSVRLSLDLLADGALGVQTQKARDVIAVAERNVSRMVNLTNDILDLKRLEAGRTEMPLEPLSIQTVIERSIEEVRPVANQRLVKLVTEPSPARGMGDTAKLIQVVVNLLSNAVKFSPPERTVRVEAECLGEWVEVRVHDEGCGVPAEYRQSIFEPFRQVASSDSAAKGGTGLGLAICKAIIGQHGGSIGVESEVGKGSTFWFRIPAAAPEAAAGDTVA